MEHFVECVREDKQPLETGEDGRAVLEIIFAAYESAGTGRKVRLPFRPPAGVKPVELWRSWLKATSGGSRLNWCAPESSGPAGPWGQTELRRHLRKADCA